MNIVYDCQCGGEGKIEIIKVEGKAKHIITCSKCEHKSHPPLSTVLGALYQWKKQNKS